MSDPRALSAFLHFFMAKLNSFPSVEGKKSNSYQGMYDSRKYINFFTHFTYANRLQPRNCHCNCKHKSKVYLQLTNNTYGKSVFLCK